MNVLTLSNAARFREELLELEGEVLISGNEGVSHAPKLFFRLRQGLWVPESLRWRVLASTSSQAPATTLSLRYYEVLKVARDSEVRPTLPLLHEFSPNELCAAVASLLARQSRGEFGVLYRGGRNLFYVRTPAGIVPVFVSWDRLPRKWLVCPRDFDAPRNGNRAGDRIFVRAAGR